MQVVATTEEDAHSVAFRTILVATDGSADAHVALDAAADLAKRSGSTLHLVTAYEAPAAVYAAPNYLGLGELLGTLEEAARDLLSREKVRVEGLGSSVHGLHAERGPACEAIVQIADMVDADLIVVGSRDSGALRRIIAGSVSTQVLHRTQRPVLIVRGGATSWPPAHMIVGFDRSSTSRCAAQVAASIARLYADASMELLEVVPPPSAQAIGYVSYSDDDEVEQGSLDMLAKSLEDAAGHVITAAQAPGDPAAVLLARANSQTGSSLIVVGSRGLGSVRRLLLGSVSTKLLHSGHTPLLIVPADEIASSPANTSP
jgi:nucleotide-binding universal stress UspA family protein